MMIPHGGEPPLYFTFPLLEKEPGLIAGFSTRHSCDDLSIFAAAAGFDLTRAVLTQQTHTVNIYEAREEDAGRGITRPLGYRDIDGLYTEALNLPLLTFHADCVPLFFYAPQRRMAGVAHGGWRGTAGDIAGIMVRTLLEQGCAAKEILAAIGPSAGPCCYQVGPEVAEEFAAITDEQGQVYIADPAAPGKFLLDLWRANRALLLRAGLLPEHIAIGGLCTVCHPETFYSHRVHGLARGTMATMIMLT